MVQIAILGYGVVGSGVAELIRTHKQRLLHKSKEEVNIKYILDIRDFSGTPFDGLFTKNFEEILNDDEVKIVVEVMGGVTFAYDYVKRCLLNGKNVVTSNKELVAAKGAELLKIARENNLNFLFEASVGGGIPIIRPINQCLAANEVDEIAGILNGTTNFILTKMIREKMDFDAALKLAQELGYAERNPAADIEGHDTCRKICILASLAFGKHVYPDNVYTQGITEISASDVEYANIWGGVIKLIGRVKKLENEKLDVIVAPMFISRECQLSSVDDVFNAIMVRGDCAGDVIFYGRGAGKFPTASAVVADVIDCIKHLKARKYLYWEDSVSEELLIPDGESETALYIRMKCADTESTFELCKEEFGEIRRLYKENADVNELAIVTESNTMTYFDNGIKNLKNNGIEIESVIRIAGF
ncbi:MAG: homoserine dehydrogenase [Acutalibacteraceae bacterium]